MVILGGKNMEKYSLKKFTELGRRVTAEPAVTITKGGNLNFNKGFMDNLGKGMRYVVLYYDESKKVIGLELSKEKLDFAYVIRIYRDGKLGVVTSIAFLKHHKIPHDIPNKPSSSYRAIWNEENQMVLIDLNKPIK